MSFENRENVNRVPSDLGDNAAVAEKHLAHPFPAPLRDRSLRKRRLCSLPGTFSQALGPSACHGSVVPNDVLSDFEQVPLDAAGPENRLL